MYRCRCRYRDRYRCVQIQIYIYICIYTALAGQSPQPGALGPSRVRLLCPASSVLEIGIGVYRYRYIYMYVCMYIYCACWTVVAAGRLGAQPGQSSSADSVGRVPRGASPPSALVNLAGSSPPIQKNSGSLSAVAAVPAGPARSRLHGSTPRHDGSVRRAGPDRAIYVESGSVAGRPPRCSGRRGRASAAGRRHSPAGRGDSPAGDSPAAGPDSAA
jgi:hypothetical protein